MESRTYYGEYSLNHWIKLMLTQNIVLPEYQRSFVWDEDNVKRLIKSFKEKQFVQPVTIAVLNTSKAGKQNLILDGQQRLTSVLLACLGYMPDKSKMESSEELGTADDEKESEEEDLVLDNPEEKNNKKSIKWTFEQLLSNEIEKNSIEEIKKRLSTDTNYFTMDVKGIDKSFLENTFLGFSYIVPDSKNEKEILQNYTRLFRNINYFGVRLSPLESRRSLYFMNENFRGYFEGLTATGEDVLCNITIEENKRNCKLDFVRYLSMLSQYFSSSEGKKDKKRDKKVVMKWYSAYSSRESYYADYVSYILNLDQEDHKTKFDDFKFNDVFNTTDVREARFEILRKSVEQLKNQMDLTKTDAYSSWIDADYWLFGLIFQIVFLGKELKDDRTNLCNEIKQVISRNKKDKEYAKSPNKLGNLRERLEKSIIIYSRHVQ